MVMLMLMLIPQQARLRLDRSYPLHNFIVVILEYMAEEPPTQVLQRSAGFCKMAVQWQYRGTNTCFVTVDGQQVCESEGGSKAEARDKAASLAIQILRRHCYTIQVKNQYLSDGTKVDLIDVEVNSGVGEKAAALGTSNMGHKLLSLMGWSGGGTKPLHCPGSFRSIMFPPPAAASGDPAAEEQAAEADDGR